MELLGERFSGLTASQLQQERQQEGFLEAKPWMLQKQLQLGSFDTAVRIMRVFEEAVRAMPLDAFGRFRRIRLDDFFEALLQPAADAPLIVICRNYRKRPRVIHHDHPDFTQELPRKSLPTRAKESPKPPT